MPSMLDLSCYNVARRFLQDGRRDWTLVLVGELMHSRTGRPLAFDLLAEMYGATGGTRASSDDAGAPAAGFATTLHRET